MSIPYKPKEFGTVTPYFVAEHADRLLTFVKSAFNAEEVSVLRRPNGDIANAAVKIGDSAIMIAQAMKDWPGTPCQMYLYVPDTDATYQRALQAGGTSIMEPADQFYGDRNAGVKDGNGNTWWIATHIEDVADDELQKRMAELKR
jgi:PhnB protein